MGAFRGGQHQRSRKLRFRIRRDHYLFGCERNSWREGRGTARGLNRKAGDYTTAILRDANLQLSRLCGLEPGAHHELGFRYRKQPADDARFVIGKQDSLFAAVEDEAIDSDEAAPGNLIVAEGDRRGG